jgi:hypothetical protein
MTSTDEPIPGGPEALLIKPISKEKLLDAIERASGIT